MPDYQQTPSQARNSIKSLNAELSNLTPSALVTMFEIDISEILRENNINLNADALDQGITQGNGTFSDGILRFHNNTKIFNSFIVWQGKKYWPVPIQATGFEVTTKGALPTPSLSIASNSETGADQLALLKYEIRKIGDIIGAKVTRKRTFAKYLDLINFGTVRESKIGRDSSFLPQGYEPDPYAYLPDDVYYIERKQTENKINLVYQLSSVLDLEGTKLPKRMILSNKCVWQYRGIGCWYQAPSSTELDQYTSETTSENNPIPILKKASLKTLKNNGIIPSISDTASSSTKLNACGMLKAAPPVATDADDDIITESQRNVDNTGYDFTDIGEYKQDYKQKNDPNDPSLGDMGYRAGNYVYIEKKGVKYYYVCKRSMGFGGEENIAPPNTDFWVADECSKSLTGCRLRWGGRNRKSTNKGGCEIAIGNLPFGGFPAANSISRGMG